LFEDGRAAGRALLPVGRAVEEGLGFAGRRDVPEEGLTASPPAGLRDVPGRTDCEVRVPVALPRVATVRVDIRPFASRVMAVRDAVRVAVPSERLPRPVRTSIREREADRTPRVLLSIITAPG